MTFLVNKRGKPISLPFGHGEICSRIGKCQCAQRGKGGAIHLNAKGTKGFSRPVHDAFLQARSVINAINAGAITTTDKNPEPEQKPRAKKENELKEARPETREKDNKQRTRGGK